MSLFSKFKPKKIGIDLGTANSCVFLEGEGLVLEEPTYVAIDKNDMTIICVGKEAKNMMGKSPENIVIKRPLRDGVIANSRVTEELLKHFINQTLGRIRLFKPDIVISTPYGITSVERRAVFKSALKAGANNVYLIPEPLAAAIGAKLPVHSSFGSMIVNMGGGTSEIAVISMNGIVVASSLRSAGDALNEAIMAYVKKKFNIVIGEHTAEAVKLAIGSAIETKDNLSYNVSGRNVGSGLPVNITLTSNDIALALKTCLRDILLEVKRVLERTPPELSADIMDKGILLSGGTSLLRNLDKLFIEALGVPVYLAEDPIHCVVNGTGIAINYLDVLEKSLYILS